MNRKIYGLLFTIIQVCFLYWIFYYSNLFELFNINKYSSNYDKYISLLCHLFLIGLSIVLYLLIRKFWKNYKEKKSILIYIISIIINIFAIRVLVENVYDNITFSSITISPSIIYIVLFLTVYITIEIFKNKNALYTKKDILLLVFVLSFGIFINIATNCIVNNLFGRKSIYDLLSQTVTFFNSIFYLIPVYVLVNVYTACILLNKNNTKKEISDGRRKEKK